jgi:hypothetical protein
MCRQLYRWPRSGGYGLELAVKGFIVMTARGRWYGRQATTYSVSDRPRKNNPPTNAWRAWRESVHVDSSPNGHSSLTAKW